MVPYRRYHDSEMMRIMKFERPKSYGSNLKNWIQYRILDEWVFYSIQNLELALLAVETIEVRRRYKRVVRRDSLQRWRRPRVTGVG